MWKHNLMAILMNVYIFTYMYIYKTIFELCNFFHLLFNAYDAMYGFFKNFDTNTKWSYGRTVQFIDMQSFASCRQRPKMLFNIWYMVLYFIRKVRKENIWKHVILGKAISLRGSAKNENVRSETAFNPHYRIGYKTTTNERILMK